MQLSEPTVLEVQTPATVDLTASHRGKSESQDGINSKIMQFIKQPFYGQRFLEPERG